MVRLSMSVIRPAAWLLPSIGYCQISILHSKVVVEEGEEAPPAALKHTRRPTLCWSPWRVLCLLYTDARRDSGHVKKCDWERVGSSKSKTRVKGATAKLVGHPLHVPSPSFAERNMTMSAV
eukprot:scaffold23287_cov36-Tisochrysis_lutea.AAC.2